MKICFDTHKDRRAGSEAGRQSGGRAGGREGELELPGGVSGKVCALRQGGHGVMDGWECHESRTIAH